MNKNDTFKTMISLAVVAISLTVGLVLLQYGHGQTLDNITEEAIEVLTDPKYNISQENQEIAKIERMQKQRESILNFCLEHADRPNPIQDLIDKGFLPEGYKETCKSVKQAYDMAPVDIAIQQQKIEAKEAVKNEVTGKVTDKFNKCLRDAITVANITTDECSRLYQQPLNDLFSKQANATMKEVWKG